MPRLVPASFFRCSPHQALMRQWLCPPAMAAGVTSKLWERSDMVEVLEAWESVKDVS